MNNCLRTKSSVRSPVSIPFGRKDREPDLSYLEQPVRYDGDDKLLDTENDAVMMEWEAPLMKRHAEVGTRQLSLWGPASWQLRAAVMHFGS